MQIMWRIATVPVRIIMRNISWIIFQILSNNNYERDLRGAVVIDKHLQYTPRLILVLSISCSSTWVIL